MNATRRKVAVALGILALGVGFVLTATADTDGSTDATAVVSIAGAALAVVTTYALYRSVDTTGTVEPRRVEDATQFPAPGDEFDRILAQFDGSGRGILNERKAVHDRLRDLAAQILARRQNCTVEEAADAVAEGDWPDDPYVAGFLRNPDVALPRTWTDRLRSIVGLDDVPSDFQKLVRRTVDGLAARSELVEDGGESTVVREPGARTDDRKRYTTPRPHAGRAGDGEPSTPLDVISTGRWTAAIPVGLALLGFGFALRRPVLVLAGVVAVGFAVYARATAPSSARLVVERSVDADDPDPGDEVEVTTTVRNEGDRAIPDLRIVNGVPPDLAVSEGSPRHGTALRPGESATVSYSVSARRGRHEFGPAYAVVRDLAGATARVTVEPVSASSDRHLSCVPELGGLPMAVPLYEQSGQYLGRIPAEGGEGVEFHATREYRPGDPSTRIDWKRLARSGNDELTTIQFREERAATVVLAIDAFPNAYVAANATDPGAVERSVDAAGRLFDSLLASGDRVGVAALGPVPLWIEAGTGVEHRRHVADHLATSPGLAPSAPSTDDVPVYWSREFHRRFPAETQVILLSPLCDFQYRFVIHRLRAYGHPVTVVSPDPTVDGTVGRRLVRVERRHQIEALRESGVRVVDWDPTDDLAVALGRAGERWSR